MNLSQHNHSQVNSNSSCIASFHTSNLQALLCGEKSQEHPIHQHNNICLTSTTTSPSSSSSLKQISSSISSNSNSARPPPQQVTMMALPNAVGAMSASTSTPNSQHPSSAMAFVNGNLHQVVRNASNSNVSVGGEFADENLLAMSQSLDSVNAVGVPEGGNDSKDVRTLFVSGLPMDARNRELYLLFRGYNGYLWSTLKASGKNGKPTAPVGFVTFDTREQAEKAMYDLQGVKFDPESHHLMRLEFARTNTKVTKPKSPSAQAPSGLPFGLLTANNPSGLGILSPATGPLPTLATTSVARNPQLSAGSFGPQQATLIHHLPGFDAPLLTTSSGDHAWAHLGYDGALLATGLFPSTALQATILHPSQYHYNF